MFSSTIRLLLKGPRDDWRWCWACLWGPMFIVSLETALLDSLVTNLGSYHKATEEHRALSWDKSFLLYHFICVQTPPPLGPQG